MRYYVATDTPEFNPISYGLCGKGVYLYETKTGALQSGKSFLHVVDAQLHYRDLPGFREVYYIEQNFPSGLPESFMSNCKLSTYKEDIIRMSNLPDNIPGVVKLFSLGLVTSVELTKLFIQVRDGCFLFMQSIPNMDHHLYDGEINVDVERVAARAENIVSNWIFNKVARYDPNAQLSGYRISEMSKPNMQIMKGYFVCGSKIDDINKRIEYGIFGRGVYLYSDPYAAAFFGHRYVHECEVLVDCMYLTHIRDVVDMALNKQVSTSIYADNVVAYLDRSLELIEAGMVDKVDVYPALKNLNRGEVLFVNEAVAQNSIVIVNSYELSEERVRELDEYYRYCKEKVDAFMSDVYYNKEN